MFRQTYTTFAEHSGVSRAAVQDMLQGFIRWPVGVVLATTGVAVGQWGTGVQIVGVLNKIERLEMAVDKRLDAVDRRFDAVDQRLEEIARAVADIAGGCRLEAPATVPGRHKARSDQRSWTACPP